VGKVDRIKYERAFLATTQMTESREFGRIMVAFDGSKDAVKAVQLAASLSLKFGADLTVIHVFASPAIGFTAASGMPLPDYSDLEEAAKEAGQKILSRGLQLASDTGVKAKGELLEASSVVEAIVDFAAKRGAELIVVGTRGMTGFKKLILGSVSSGLISHAHCPVLVAR
jgi:nucleotide-binding universal stress UspA family protein